MEFWVQLPPSPRATEGQSDEVLSSDSCGGDGRKSDSNGFWCNFEECEIGFTPRPRSTTSSALAA